MKQVIATLWAGEVPLKRAFWEYAVLYGLLLNLVLHLVFVMLLVYDAPMAFVAAAFVASIPYNLFVTVAVWRSAGRYEGSTTWADLARLFVVLWMIALTIM